MLVVISDLHLSDPFFIKAGTTLNRTINPKAFDIFVKRVIEAAERLGWENETSYPKEIDIVLNGDILDFIRSALWYPFPARPWNNPIGPGATEPLAQPLPLSASVPDIIEAIWDSLSNHEDNRAAFGCLTALQSSIGDHLRRTDITVRIHYLVGNHDWFLHLPTDPALDRVRNSIIATMGLCPITHPNDATPFPYDPLTESPFLLDKMLDHRVFARHGDFLDSWNFSGNNDPRFPVETEMRNQSSRGDALVIELFSGFAVGVLGSLPNLLPQITRDRVRDYLLEIDNLRPYSLFPEWLQTLLNGIPNGQGKGVVEETMARVLKRCIGSLIDAFKCNPAWKGLSSLSSLVPEEKYLDLASGIIRILTFMDKIHPFLDNCAQDCRDGAYFEGLLRTGQVNYVVYGHTHHYEITPLDNVSLSRGGTPQTYSWYYLNSGTWRPVIRKCVRETHDPAEFVNYHNMSYMIFYTDAELRPGNAQSRFDCWNGDLEFRDLPIEADHDLFLLAGTLVPPPPYAINFSDYRVFLYDKDFLDPDDFLGYAIPNAIGTFEIGFMWEDFAKKGQQFPKPYLVIKANGTEIKRTGPSSWQGGKYFNIGSINI
jgi:UDP-2,3-diacylglucosamine pyrophosphatase LpxH